MVSLIASYRPICLIALTCSHLDYVTTLLLLLLLLLHSLYQCSARFSQHYCDCIVYCTHQYHRTFSVSVLWCEMHISPVQSSPVTMATFGRLLSTF